MLCRVGRRVLPRPGGFKRPSAGRCPQAACRRPPVHPEPCQPQGYCFLPPLQAPRGGPRAAPVRSVGRGELRCPCWPTPFLIDGYVESVELLLVSARSRYSRALVLSRRRSASPTMSTPYPYARPSTTSARRHLPLRRSASRTRGIGSSGVRRICSKATTVRSKRFWAQASYSPIVPGAWSVFCPCIRS